MELDDKYIYDITYLVRTIVHKIKITSINTASIVTTKIRPISEKY
jgi:hypothetical protein